MKRLLPFLIMSLLVVLPGMSATTTKNTKSLLMEVPKKYKVYCEISYMPFQRIAIVNIGSTMDAIRDKNGKPIEFISIIDAINYMAKVGWELTEVYGVPKGDDKSTYYFLCKEVANESEITEGLNLKPLDKNFNIFIDIDDHFKNPEK